MPTLELNFLGPPQILLDGTPVAFDSRKGIALLAYLAATEDRHTRAELALLLWPESDKKRARGALRYTLSIVKSALGEGWLILDGQHVSLNALDRAALPPVEPTDTQGKRLLLSDIARFRALLNAPDLSDDAPKAAAALYRDDFLSGFSLRDSVNFEEWQFFQREEFRQQLVGALAALADDAGKRGDTAAAVHHARRLLQLDPLREDIQRSLMRLLAGWGQQAAALQQFDDFARWLDKELGVPPSQPTVALAEQIRAGIQPTPSTPHHSPASVPNNLTSAAGRMVGRERELQAVHAQLEDDDCRLLTLIGAGGMGKTRLAQQIAVDYVNSSDPAGGSMPHPFPDGVYFVSLATIESRGLLLGAIAGALGVQFAGPEPPQQQLINAVRPRRMLLVLDNFEQLAGEASALRDLLDNSPGVKLLVTSRERLQLYAEWLFEVTSLTVPPAVRQPLSDEQRHELLAFGSVQLFCQRARRVNPGFHPEAALTDVVRICRLVQGMPLGIELAAGWVRLLSAGEIAAQLQANLDLLVTELQDVPQRHRSLRAVYRYSRARLTDQERAVFARLTVFRGGFEREAAAAVAGATQLMLARLVDKSMIQRAARNVRSFAGVSGRYLIHEMLRQFGQEELTETARRAACGAHARYFAWLLRDLAVTRQRAEESNALVRIDGELDNVIAAWEWLVNELGQAEPSPRILEQMLAAAPMLGCFLQRRARFQEGCALFSAALSAARNAESGKPGAPTEALIVVLRVYLAEQYFSLSEFERVLALCADVSPQLQAGGFHRIAAEAHWLRGSAQIRMGNYAAAEAELGESLALFRKDGDQAASTLALNALGIAYSNQGKYAEARPFYEEFLAISRTTGYTRGIANALNNLGSNYARAGEHDRALTYYRESYQLSLECGEQLLIAVALSNLGSVSRALGAYDEARRYYAESLEISRAIGVRRWTSANLNGLGLTLVQAGEDRAAAPVLVESLLLAQEIGSKPDALDALATAGDLLAAVGQPAVAAWLWRYVDAHPNSMSQAQQRCRTQLAGMHAPGGEDTSSSTAEIGFDSEAGVEEVLDDVISHVINRLHALPGGVVRHRTGEPESTD